MQEAVEKTALDLYKKDVALACSFLNLYSNGLGLKAYHRALELADALRTQYYR